MILLCFLRHVWSQEQLAAAPCLAVAAAIVPLLAHCIPRPLTHAPGLRSSPPHPQVCNVDGKCIDPSEDEVFSLTTKDGKFAVNREATKVETEPFDAVITFEQDPNQILDALLPLYMNSQILRALQESIASELAARMTAMGAASDNAKTLGKSLNLTYNRKRQAVITSQLIELVAGAAAI